MSQDPDQRKIPLRRVAPDRIVIEDDDREVCNTCGELPANSITWPGRCKRCERALQDERLAREAEWK